MVSSIGHRRLWVVVGLLGLVWTLAWVPGCGGGPQRAQRPMRPDIVARDVPPVLRGTIGSEARLEGLDPTIVTGYGLVVGLSGTGSSDVPLGVRAVLEREMLGLGVGREPGPLANVTPSMIIEDRNTAVVLVQAVIPPAAAVGSTFDVRVATLPGSATTSLAGGRLFTTELRRGETSPSAPATPTIARASGDLFINPLTDGSNVGSSGVGSTRARIIGGGTIVTPFRPTLTLDVPSHGRVRAVVDAINGRFGRIPRPAAVGLNEEMIEIDIPAAYRDDTDEFVNILRHLRIDQRFSAEYAQRYVNALKSDSTLAENLSWCLVAIGESALPIIWQLYDYREDVPRLAALQAGARLGDPTVRDELEQLILEGPRASQTRAVRLMADLDPTDLNVNAFLFDLMAESTEPEVIVAAYETLADRGDIRVRGQLLPGPFRLDVVESARPLVYASQSERPIVAVIGPSPELREPSYVEAFDGRLLIKRERSAGDNSADARRRAIEMFYRAPDGRTITATSAPDIRSVVRVLAHTPTPESPRPGFSFNYSSVVGTLYEMTNQGALEGDFFAQSQIRELELLRRLERDTLTSRPELSAEDPSGDPFAPIAPENRPSDELVPMGIDADNPTR